MLIFCFDLFQLLHLNVLKETLNFTLRIIVLHIFYDYIHPT